jgi:DNA-binding beta-propeller fold protein YncE
MRWCTTISSRRTQQNAEFVICVVVIASFFVSLSCDGPSGPTVVSPPLPLPEDAALYVSMDGEGAGLWVLNANTLELVDSLITEPGVPWTIEFSPDGNTGYSCWGNGAGYALHSVAIYPSLVIQNSVPLAYAKYALAETADGGLLVAYGYKGIDVFDRATLGLFKSDTTLGLYSRIALSRISDKLFFTYWPTNGQLVGFGVYSLDSLKIIDTISVFDSATHPGLQDADLLVSNDDRLLFFSAWNWRGAGGFGSFFVIDVADRKIIAEIPCGAFAQLALSPDGQDVYLSDPGGYLYGFPSSGQVLRYDVTSNTMHIVLKSLGGTDRIAVAEDNRTVFISPWISFPMPDGRSASVIRVDGHSGVILTSYPTPLDSLGHFSTHPRNIKFGKYTTTSATREKAGNISPDE